MTRQLQGKTALVTGASRGIGAAIAIRLAKDGANVAITYGKSAAEAESVVKAISAHGVRAKAYQADAGKPEVMPNLASDVIADFGNVDILVNNAGVLSGDVIGQQTLDEYNRVFNVNVASVFALTNALVPSMKPGSRIINISSILGERALAPGLGIYNASKFAVTGFSRSWAKDLGSKGILVNAVQPGPVNTDMNPDSGEAAEFMKAQTALGRYGNADEIAGVVAFFAGPDSSYVTGTTINVDGGWAA